MRARFGNDPFEVATTVTLHPGEQAEVEDFVARPRKAWLAGSEPADELQPRVLTATLATDDAGELLVLDDGTVQLTVVLAHPNPDAEAADPPVRVTGLSTEPDPTASRRRGSID